MSKSRIGKVFFYVENKFISSKKYTSVRNRNKIIEDWLSKYKKLYPRQYLYVNIKPDINE